MLNVSVINLIGTQATNFLNMPKTQPKKTITKKRKELTGKVKLKVAKKLTKLKLSSSKNTFPTGRKLISKKTLTEKEREQREANLIANLENKKKISPVKRPKKNSTEKQTTSLLQAIIEGMKERKAKNITILNLNKINNRVTDYFVICDADSNTHVNSISDSVEEFVTKSTSEKVYHIEGKQNGEWILIDYINIVVHVFLRESREHYNLEGLWGDTEIINIID